MKRISFVAVLVLTALSSAAQDKYPEYEVKYGPWIQNVTEDSFTVVWMSTNTSMVSVEVAPDDGSAFEAQQREAFYESCAGRRLNTTRHSVRVTGLEPGKSYRYRTIGSPIIDGSRAYSTLYGYKTCDGEGVVRTLDTSKRSCTLAMFNDIHKNVPKYTDLLRGVERDKYDFLLLNGDIVSATVSIDTSAKYTFGPLGELGRNMPVFFARGNHEGRGEDWYLTRWMFPTSTGEFYYTFRQGPVAFVVLDAGEDKPDSSPEYSGYAVYDQYRAEELEWLKGAVNSPEFSSAPVKVCIIHIPTIKEEGSWYAEAWINANFLPVLNEAGIDLMLSGHHHRHFVKEKGTCGNSFPIVVNTHDERLDFSADAAGHISLKTVGRDGKVTHTYDYTANILK